MDEADKRLLTRLVVLAEAREARAAKLDAFIDDVLPLLRAQLAHLLGQVAAEMPTNDEPPPVS